VRSGPYGRAWPPARPPRARRARLEEHRRRSAPGAGLPDGQGRQRPAQPVAAARAAAGPPRRRRSARPHRSESAQASYCPPSSTLRHQPPLAALAPAARRAAAAARGCLSWGQRLATRRGWGRTAPQLPASSPASSPSARQPRRARRGLRERSPARRRCRRSRPEPAPLPLRSGAPCLRHTARARLRRTPCCGPRRLERSAPGDCCCTARVGLAGLHGPRAARSPGLAAHPEPRAGRCRGRPASRAPPSSPPCVPRSAPRRAAARARAAAGWPRAAGPRRRPAGCLRRLRRRARAGARRRAGARQASAPLQQLHQCSAPHALPQGRTREAPALRPHKPNRPLGPAPRLPCSLAPRERARRRAPRRPLLGHQRRPERPPPCSPHRPSGSRPARHRARPRRADPLPVAGARRLRRRRTGSEARLPPARSARPPSPGGAPRGRGRAPGRGPGRRPRRPAPGTRRAPAPAPLGTAACAGGPRARAARARGGTRGRRTWPPPAARRRWSSQIRRGPRVCYTRPAAGARVLPVRRLTCSRPPRVPHAPGRAGLNRVAHQAAPCCAAPSLNLCPGLGGAPGGTNAGLLLTGCHTRLAQVCTQQASSTAAARVRAGGPVAGAARRQELALDDLPRLEHQAAVLAQAPHVVQAAHLCQVHLEGHHQPAGDPGKLQCERGGCRERESGCTSHKVHLNGHHQPAGQKASALSREVCRERVFLCEEGDRRRGAARRLWSRPGTWKGDTASQGAFCCRKRCTCSLTLCGAAQALLRRRAGPRPHVPHSHSWQVLKVQHWLVFYSARHVAPAQAWKRVQLTSCAVCRQVRCPLQSVSVSPSHNSATNSPAGQASTASECSSHLEVLIYEPARARAAACVSAPLEAAVATPQAARGGR